MKEDTRACDPFFYRQFISSYSSHIQRVLISRKFLVSHTLPSTDELKIMEAEVMIGETDFAQRSGVAQVNTQICIKRRRSSRLLPLISGRESQRRKKENEGRQGRGKDRKEENPNRRKSIKLACPSASAYAYHCILGVWAFPAPSTTTNNL